MSRAVCPSSLYFPCPAHTSMMTACRHERATVSLRGKYWNLPARVCHLWQILAFALLHLPSEEISRKKTTIHSQPPREAQLIRPNLYSFLAHLPGNSRFPRKNSTNLYLLRFQKETRVGHSGFSERNIGFAHTPRRRGEETITRDTPRLPPFPPTAMSHPCKP